MSSNKTKVDLSLDDIIKMNRSGGGRSRNNGRRSGGSGNFGGRQQKQQRRSFPSGVSNSRITKSSGSSQFQRTTTVPDVWRHDLFADSAADPPARRAQLQTAGNHRASSAFVVRISNLHFNVTDSDIKELFGEIGAITKAELHYDKSGRSLGTAEVEYRSRADAEKAVKQYNRVPLDGQPMEIILVDDTPSRVTRDVAPTNGIAGRLGTRDTRNDDRPRARNPDSASKFSNRDRRGGDRPARPFRGRQGRGGGRTEDRAATNLTREQLDAELDDYLAKVPDVEM